MKGVLLDTNVILFASSRSKMLSPKIRRCIESRPLFLSTISYWEVVLKTMKGKLALGDPRRWWSSELADLAAIPLPLAPEHVAAIFELPPLHADPFDRALIAQATVAGLALATTDRQIERYSSRGLQVIS